MRDAPMGKGSGEWGLRFGNEILRLRFAALRACEEIPSRRQFEHVFQAKLSLKSGVIRINSQALRMTCRWGAALRSGWHVGEDGCLRGTPLWG